MKKLLFIFLFAFAVNDSFSQNWLWAKSGTGNADGEGYATCTDPQGNVYITGSFNSASITFGSFTLIKNIYDTVWHDVFIAKYDSVGNVLWAKSAGGTKGDGGVSLCLDPLGNIYLTGNTASPSITFGSFVLSNTTYFIVKYDGNGNVIWATSAVGYVLPDDICIDIFGNIYVVGMFATTSATFGTFTLNNSSANYYEAFIVKYDVNGNALWAKSEGGIDDELFYSVKPDALGNIYVSGTFSSSSFNIGTFTLNNAGATHTSCDIFTVKYDVTGNVVWAQKYGGTGTEFPLALAINAAGDLYMTGHYDSPTLTFGNYSLSPIFGRDVFIVKYNGAGNILWAQNAGGDDDEGANTIDSDSLGNIYISGYFRSSSITFGSITLSRPTGAFSPMFIASYDPNGNALCASVLQDDGATWHSVSADRFGNAYVTGGFYHSPFIVGLDTLINTNNDNAYLAKWRCQNKIIEPLNPCQNIFVPTAFSPNNDGANDTLFVRSECIKTMELKIYDRLGEKVFETNDITKGWDGNFNGEKMNDAVFVYFLTGFFNDGTAFSKKGDVSLIR